MFQIRYADQIVSLPVGELLLVGRGELCDIQIDDPSASRVHCRLLASERSVMLTDAGSRWGTFVNGEKVDQAELTVGDEITIGETVLQLQAESHPQAATIRPRAAVGQGGDILQLSNDIKRKPSPFPADDQSPLAFVPASFLNKKFLRYQMEELIAHTRTGLVFRANDLDLCRTVAVKLFRPDFMESEQVRKRFLRAVRTMSDFRHPHIISLHDAGEHAGLLYTISEFIDGNSAAELIKKIGIAGMLDWRTTLEIAIQLCDALSVIHQQGIVHRNIQPEHILVRSSDQIALLGEVVLAKAWDCSQPDCITRAGDVAGELGWQSPEQLGNGEPVDHRSDLFQLGMTIYALLTGKSPFESKSNSKLIKNIMNEVPIPPKSVHLSIPEILQDVVMKSLEKVPRNRYADAESMKSDLLRVKKFQL